MDGSNGCIALVWGSQGILLYEGIVNGGVWSFRFE